MTSAVAYAPRRSFRRGYALLLVLLLLALSALALTATARSGLAKAMAARSAEESLQRRWGMISCRAAVLPKADRIMARLEAETHRPAPRMDTDLVLSDHHFELVLADEQAKANVNALVKARGLASLERTLTEALRAAGHIDAVRLTPSAAAPGDARAGFTGLGQVFPDAAPRDLHGRLAAGVTCWGDGLLNVRRCSVETLLGACAPALTRGEAKKLSDLCRSGFDLEAALNALALPTRNHDVISTALTDTSSCYSLWIVARNGSRAWYHLAVDDGSADERGPAQIDMQW